MHAPYRGHRIIPAAAPLDGFTQPAAAYSFRKLRTAYTGPAVKLQRVDTTVQIIGFVGNDFDTAAAAAFCTTACTVNTWYDQSGNGRHLLQATAANQPAYVAACNGVLPCARATVATQTLVALGSVTPAGAVSMAAVGNRSAGTAASCGFIRLNGLAANRIGAQAVANGWFVHNGTTPLNAAAADNAWHTAVGVLNGASTSLTIDGVQTTGSLTPSVAAGTPMAAVGGASVTCNFAEAVAWSDYALTPAEIAALQQNQRDYWIPQVVGIANPAAAYSFRKIVSLYNGPAVKLRRTTGGTQDIGFVGNDFDTAAAATFCAATTCFIDTWYDQSGNARHLPQTTLADQPEYIANCNGALPCSRSAVGFSRAFLLAGGAAVAPVSLNVVARQTVRSTTACRDIWIGNGNELAQHATLDLATLSSGASNMTAPSAALAWHSRTGVANGAASVLRVDSTETTGTVTVDTTAGNTVVNYNYGGGATCDVSEAIAWSGYALTAPERLALAQNQRDYWMPLPLDTFATPAAAYSMRRLKSTYAGPAIRLRRTSDNAEQDINFLSFTGFTGAPIDTAAAAAFCAATTCTVATWYDQSGNARHVTQATVANQPRYIANCNGTLPCARSMTIDTIEMRSAVPFLSAIPVSLSTVARRSGGIDFCAPLFYFYHQIYADNNPDYWVLQAGGTPGVLYNGATEGVWHAAEAVVSGASSAFRIDATEVTGPVDFIGGTPDTVRLAARAAIAGSALCDMTEAVVWNGYGLTAGDRAALQTNQKSFWGTP
jgi:hypothetical protein